MALNHPEFILKIRGGVPAFDAGSGIRTRMLNLSTWPSTMHVCQFHHPGVLFRPDFTTVESGRRSNIAIYIPVDNCIFEIYFRLDGCKRFERFQERKEVSAVVPIGYYRIAAE